MDMFILSLHTIIYVHLNIKSYHSKANESHPQKCTQKAATFLWFWFSSFILSIASGGMRAVGSCKQI